MGNNFVFLLSLDKEVNSKQDLKFVDQILATCFCTLFDS